MSLELFMQSDTEQSIDTETDYFDDLSFDYFDQYFENAKQLNLRMNAFRVEDFTFVSFSVTGSREDLNQYSKWIRSCTIV
jgi:hypothetical protein